MVRGADQLEVRGSASGVYSPDSDSEA
jgi:hypothetical protein